MKTKDLGKICDKIEKVIDKNEISYLFIGRDREGTVEVISGDDRNEISESMFYTILATENIKLSKKLTDMLIDVILGIMDSDTNHSEYVKGHILSYLQSKVSEGYN